MKLKKAIEIAESRVRFLFGGTLKKDREAIDLLIEAGKLVQKEREFHLSFAGELLPGETEDA